MLYYENNKKVRYNPYNMKYDKKLGMGEEGIVYLINNMAVKFYKNSCIKSRLSKETVDKMTKINTKRILLPKEALLSKKRELMGYKTKYIDDRKIDSFFLLNKDSLKDEMKIINEDINILNDNNILMDDLTPSNTVYNNGLYFIDPGSFAFEDGNVEGKNIDRINEYFYLLFRSYCKKKYSIEYSQLMIYIRNNICNGGWNYFNYLMNEFEYENLEQLVIDIHEKVRCK